MQQTVADIASAAIRSLLARGRYQPGDRLPPERELAQGLGLSRPTLREAIRRLTEAGLLEARQGSGTYVVEINFDELFALRLRLEPYAAALAAQNRGAADLGRLEALAKALPANVDDPEKLTPVDWEIHRVLAQASGNSVLVSVLERLTELTMLSRAVTSPDDQARRATVRDLKAVIRAVRRSDSDAAAAAMTAHLSVVRDVAAKSALADRRIARVTAG